MKRVKCGIALAVLLAVPGVRHAEAQLVVGHWQHGTNANLLWVGVDWNGLLAKQNEASRQGLRLTDFDSYRDATGRQFLGTWRSGAGSQTLFRGTWNEFSARHRALTARGQRLVKLRIYEDQGTTIFAGLWAAGGGAHYLWVGATWDAFRRKWEELSNSNLRLVDVETYVEGGTRKYAGVWRPGSDGHYLWSGVRLPDFEAKLAELDGQGLRLASFRTYEEGRVRRFLGVWRAGTGPEAFHVAPNWSSFHARRRGIEQQDGLRLAGVSVATGGVATFPRLAAGEPNTRVIVSLGDSYASGEGVPDVHALHCDSFSGPFGLRTAVNCETQAEWRGTAGRPESASDRQCHRSTKAGPIVAGRDFLQLASSLNSGLAFEFTSFACSGAEVMHLNNREFNGADSDGDPNLPPQVDQVAASFPTARSIDAIVISAGGNDVGFGDKVSWCATNPPWSKCFEDQPPQNGPYRQWEPIGDLKALVRNRYRELAAALKGKLLSKVGNVFVTEYPDPTRRTDRSFCGPLPLIPDVLDGVDRTEAQWASEVAIASLNDALREVTTEHGWHYIGGIAARFSGMTDPPSDGHGYCAGDRWLNTVGDGVAVEGHPYGGVHPNEKGHRVYRDAILEALEGLLPPSTPEFNMVTQAPVVTPEGIQLRWSHFPDRTASYQVAYAFEELPRRTALADDERPQPPGRKGDAPGLFVELRSLPCLFLHTSNGGTCTELSLMWPRESASDAPRPTGWFVHTVGPRPQFPGESPAREWTHAVQGDAYYAVRACSPFSCSDWSNVIWASNVP